MRPTFLTRIQTWIGLNKCETTMHKTFPEGELPSSTLLFNQVTSTITEGRDIQTSDFNHDPIFQKVKDHYINTARQWKNPWKFEELGLTYLNWRDSYIANEQVFGIGDRRGNHNKQQGQSF